MSLVRHIIEQKQGGVATIDRDATAQDAAELMHARRIGALVVLHDGNIIGIFTERDLLNRVVAEKKDPSDIKVFEVMTKKVAVCSPDTPIESCRAAMTNNKMRHLPVVNDGKLIGIISSGDILARELKEQEETIRWLHEYMHGPN
ncbi:MAG: CBS domain-containing protein [Planctomycetia bacterium]|jgi:CBS domain-containing protein|nr:CBS domain-containing protein [Planctomycetia bacterium]OQZ06607.1 MAG: hypothetical protein B6D36_04115 [Planctomycetes bacterium UTPLA1]